MNMTNIFNKTNKKIFAIMFAAVVLSMVVFICALSTGCNTVKNEISSEEMTSNINKYFNEHNIEAIIKERENSDEQLADEQAFMQARYGENKQINGEYNKDLAFKTETGIYVGKKNENNIGCWKGIPYAKAPVGDLRWKAPKKLDKTDKVYEAYYNGHSSIQAKAYDELSSLYPQGEDCLNLNIWKNMSDNSQNKPIMVWIHGGAYIQGGSVDPFYEGDNFVKNNPDFIFVSIDYRTDFLGFINLSKVPGADDYKNSANLGLLDEVAALKWLKENASAFGGDPDNITIFGESAGGGSASALTLISDAKGLFKRAILQSGVTSAYLRTAEKSISHTDKIMEICGAKNIEDLKLLNDENIRKIECIINCENGIDYTYPELDGVVLPKDLQQAMVSQQRNGIDIMVGTTKDEYNLWNMLLGKDENIKAIKNDYEQNILPKMNDEQKACLEKFKSLQAGNEDDNMLEYVTFSTFHCPARYEVDTHVANGQNAYVYYFTEESAYSELKSYHGFDVSVLFQNTQEDQVKDKVSADNLGRIMQRMWINFAKTGNPSIEAGQLEGVSQINWDKYTPEDFPVMILNSNGCVQTKDPVKEKCDLIQDLFWLRIKD